MASATGPGAPLTRPTPPWTFLFLDVPFGAAVGFYSIVVGFWLQARGHGVAEISLILATAGAPHALKLFWIPLLDLTGRRLRWYLGMAALTAATFGVLALVPDPVAHLPLLVTLLTVMQAAATTCHAANNALMATTTRPEDKGRVGGYAMASNVGFTGLMAALGLLVAKAWSPQGAALVLAALTLASATLALRIVEPTSFRPAAPPRPGESPVGAAVRAALHHLGAMLRDLWATIHSREGATGLVICLAPVGCQVMTNLFSAIAGDYGAGEGLVSLANGLGGGVAGALGAVAGGFLADRMNRRVAYAAAGGLTALVALAMAASPSTGFTYAWGTLGYSFAGGVAFATWAGMVLELVGHSAATATKYALFNASLNVAITYDTALVGQLGARIQRAAGVTAARGALVADAALTGCGILVLIALVAVTRRPARQAQGAPPVPR